MTQGTTQTSRSAVNRLAWWIAGTGTLLLVLRLVFFETREIVVDVQPQRIFADGQSSSAVRVLRLNRLGMTVPFSRVALRCMIEEGTDLVACAYNADSTRMTLTALRRPGVVRMRIETKAWPFPLYAELRLEPLIARSKHHRARGAETAEVSGAERFRETRSYRRQVGRS